MVNVDNFTQSVEVDECQEATDMENIQTRTEELLITERLLVSNPVEEKPVRGILEITMRVNNA